MDFLFAVSLKNHTEMHMTHGRMLFISIPQKINWKLTVLEHIYIGISPAYDGRSVCMRSARIIVCKYINAMIDGMRSMRSIKTWVSIRQQNFPYIVVSYGRVDFLSEIWLRKSHYHVCTSWSSKHHYNTLHTSIQNNVY